jgi:hypothetical protein
VDGSGDSSSPHNRRSSRASIMRSQTFNTPTSINSNSIKMSSDEIKSNENATCQSTPELSCSNERERVRNKLGVNMEETCGLSTSGTILTSTSLTGLTPTSSGTIDDKNEVCTCSFLFSYCFIMTYYRKKKLSDRR